MIIFEHIGFGSKSQTLSFIGQVLSYVGMTSF